MHRAITLDVVAAAGEPVGGDRRVIAPDAVIGSGGPAATASVALARLGVSTAFVGTVGDDAAGAFVREELDRGGRGFRRAEDRRGSHRDASWRPLRPSRVVHAEFGTLVRDRARFVVEHPPFQHRLRAVLETYYAAATKLARIGASAC